MSMVPVSRAFVARCAPAFHAITTTAKLSPNHSNAVLPLSTYNSTNIPIWVHGLNAYQLIRQRRGFQSTITASAGGDRASAAPFKLIIYSKQDCPLCDKLKEKLEAIMDRAAFMPSILSGVELEVRDISTNPAWEAAYAMQVPVLKAAAPDGSNEREVPRPSPRLTPDMLEKHLQKHLGSST